jgi:hypothetical protein
MELIGNRKTLLYYAVEAENIEVVKMILGHPGFSPYFWGDLLKFFVFFFFWVCLVEKFCRVIRR